MNNHLCHCKLRTRREFLRTSFLGVAMAYTVPAFLERTFGTLHAEASEALIQTATGRDANILVVIQLAGGNDGINTLVPYADDLYHKARPKLAISRDATLKLGDYAGFHPTLKNLARLHDDGLLGIVQGVGYPNPNRSHFRSTEIWQTAVDSDKVESLGWLGRYFDNYCSGEGALAGVAVTPSLPQAFAGKTPAAINFSRTHHFRLKGMDADNDDEMMAEMFRDLNSPDDSASGGSIQEVSSAGKPGGDILQFLERTALDAQVSSEKILEIAGRYKTTTRFPGSSLGGSLEMVARLVAGGLPTRVYYVSQGGYDTHVNQMGTHDRLLGELDAALAAFLAEMKTQGNLDRVLVMTFSEFGRRLAENGGGGTDHGAAAPMFLAGGAVVPGLHGSYPSLSDLHHGDLKHSTDFRCVYATILQHWLRVDPRPVLGRSFPTLPLLRTS